MFFLGLHDVGQGHITWLVQTQVGGDHSRHAQGQNFQAAIHFACHLRFAVNYFHFGRKSSLRQVRQGRQHLTGLVAIVVNGLFAQDDQTRLFFVDQGFQQFGNGQRLQFQVGGRFDQDTAIGTNGHGSAQSFLALCHAA